MTNLENLAALTDKMTTIGAGNKALGMYAPINTAQVNQNDALNKLAMLQLAQQEQMKKRNTELGDIAAQNEKDASKAGLFDYLGIAPSVAGLFVKPKTTNSKTQTVKPTLPVTSNPIDGYDNLINPYVMPKSNQLMQDWMDTAYSVTR